MHFTFYSPRIAVYTLYFALYTPHFTPHTPDSTLYTLHFILHTPHSTLYTAQATFYTLHFALRPRHSTLYYLHFHCTLHTSYFTLRILHLTLHTLHSTISTSHSTHYTLPSTSHFCLHSAMHSIPFHIPQSRVHRYRKRRNIYKCFWRTCLTKVFFVIAFGFGAWILFVILACMQANYSHCKKHLTRTFILYDF